MRHRVSIVRQDEATDPVYGQKKPSPVTVATVWARIVPLAGRELVKAQEVIAEVTHRIEIRHREDVTPRMQAVARGRTFGIEAVLNVEERGREMHLLCVEAA